MDSIILYISLILNNTARTLLLLSLSPQCLLIKKIIAPGFTILGIVTKTKSHFIFEES